MRTESNRGHTSLVERTLDGAIAVTGAIPGGRLPAAVLAILGKGGHVVDAWRKSAAAQREERQFEEVIWQAALALADGDAAVAEANVAAHADDPAFRARLHATVNKMRESLVSDNALAPLGILVAEYTTKAPDPEFRRWAALLCDADCGTLQGFKGLTHALLTAPGGAITHFNFQHVPGKGWFAVPEAFGNGRYMGQMPGARLPLANWQLAADALAEHDLLDDLRYATTPGKSEKAPQFRRIPLARLQLLARLFGLQDCEPRP